MNKRHALVAAALLQTAPSALPLHLQLAQAWNADANQTELLRAALVLLADHELNASTFAVRCVASTGASLPAALGAGLAALSGDKHGGGSAAARRMLTQALAAPDARDAVAKYYAATAPELAGFGHPLYPHDLHVIAVASDSPAPADLRDGIAWLDLNDRAGVLSWIMQRLGKQA